MTTLLFFKTILTTITVFNFFTVASADTEGVLMPENVYAFELQMVEHHIGVRLFMKYLFSQSFIAEDPDFSLLLQHKELMDRRAEQHDISKFRQTQDFVDKYYPRSPSGPISAVVYKYYGWDVRQKPKALSSDQIKEASDAFKTLNSIDNRLLEELFTDYIKDKNLTSDIIQRLKRAIDKFEHVADLVNRKLLENLNRFRTNSLLRATPKEIFEFGHQIDLNNMDPYYWNQQIQAQKIAIRLYHSPTALRLMTEITPEEIVEKYLENTKDSPFLSESENIERQKTIDRFIVRRNQLKPREQTALLRKNRYRTANRCNRFYIGRSPFY